MPPSRGITAGALFLLFTFITIFIFAIYDYLATPQFRIMPFLGFFIFLAFVFLTQFGEYLGFVMKKKNFQSEGGALGVYHYHVNHDANMSTYYVTVPTRYLKHVEWAEIGEERSVIMRFFTMLSNARMVGITDKSDLFEDTPAEQSDTPEGCIKYRGFLRKGVKPVRPMQRLMLEIDRLKGVVSECITIAEKGKASAEIQAQRGNKEMVDTAIQFGTIADNLVKVVEARGNREPPNM